MKKGRSAIDVGREGEAAAAIHLAALGYRILGQNVRFRSGEIDLVAEEKGYLVFVEVKTRRNSAFGAAVEAITPVKQRRLIKLAALYMAATGRRDCLCRFDVVMVEPAYDGTWHCTVIPDAFSAS